jgi:UDP-2,4-diacetamido-2,4,6-trideoxy-beta-L-altropyranose hydrolase
MGTGHVMRMIALGQAWQTLGGDVRFAGQTEPLTERLKDEGFDCVPLPGVHPDPEDAQTLLAATAPNDWIVIDGYHFDTAYLKAIRDSGRRTLVVDDFFDREEYPADILLNQNPDGPDYSYDKNGPTLLLGTKYTMLRKDFQRPRTLRAIPETATSILVTLGGADPDNATGKVLDAIKAVRMSDLRVTIVAGAANPHLDDLRKRIKSLPCPCELLTNVSDMPALMAEADLAVSAGGTTSWELCYFGVPFIAVRIADNQQGVIRELNRYGAARCIDRGPSVGDIATELETLIRDRKARQAMQTAGTLLVDGKGAMRVARTMYNADITLRPVEAGDCETLHGWRNAPETRAQSFSPDEIPLDTHRAWFRSKLNDEDCLFLVAMDDDEPVGQIRFDRDGQTAVVSVSVAPGMLNRGIGTITTRLGCRALARKWPSVKAVALVKPDNHASAAMFAKAGFTKAATDAKHLRFTWPGSTNDA